MTAAQLHMCLCAQSRWKGAGIHLKPHIFPARHMRGGFSDANMPKDPSQMF